MKLIILSIVAVAMYQIGYSHGYCECEEVVRETLNRLMEEMKEMEVYKTGRGRWEKQEGTRNTNVRKKKKN